MIIIAIVYYYYSIQCTVYSYSILRHGTIFGVPPSALGGALACFCSWQVDSVQDAGELDLLDDWDSWLELRL